jgi:hypothetical protein
MKRLGTFLLSVSLAVCLPIAASRAQDFDYSPLMRQADFYSDLFHKKFQNELVNPIKIRRPNTSTSPVNQQNLKAPITPTNAAKPVATTFKPTQTAGAMATKMAATYPPQRRAEVERTFRQVLQSFYRLESQLGAPKNDLAVAVAAFLAGNYMAYRDVDFPDANFIPLVRQMQSVIGTNPGFAQATNVEKQEVYEQMAILGTFMAMMRDGLKRQPSPEIAAKMRQAAKSNLEQFLKTDANRVELTSNGLVLN